MKIKLEIEVPDDFEPCAYGCEFHCPFGYLVDEDLDCNLIERDEEWNFSCIVSKAIKGSEEYGKTG